MNVDETKKADNSGKKLLTAMAEKLFVSFYAVSASGGCLSARSRRH
jgi:hypothetical protein